MSRAKSTRGEAPAINPRYLSEETDRRAINRGLRLAVNTRRTRVEAVRPG
jgi:hypothetical protein